MAIVSFMNNSGADNRAVKSNRTPGIDYEHAPVGNDVDAPREFYAKWKAAGGDRGCVYFGR